MHDVVSLFSGGGGLDLGLEQTGRFRLLACLDASLSCCETILGNYRAGRIGDRRLRIYQCDIREKDPRLLMSDLGMKVGELPLLAGAPPCQSFSSAGNRGGVQDPRGMLLWEYLRYVECLRPKAFLLENVPGLMLAALRPRPAREHPKHGGPLLADDERPGSVMRAFLASVPQGYRVDVFEVNAVNYGVPQVRERIIVIGNRFGKLAEFPKPTHGRPGQPPFRTLGDALADLCDPEPVVMEYGPMRMQLLKEGGNWRPLSEDVAQAGVGDADDHREGGQSSSCRRLSFTKPCRAVLTNPCSMFSSLYHPLESRSLSLRECARVQNFPDSWEFQGSKDEKFIQVGNAVPPRLGRVCGDMVADMLDAIVREGITMEGQPPWRIIRLWPRIRI